MRGDSLGKNQERHQQLKKGEEVANETEKEQTRLQERNPENVSGRVDPHH